MNFYNRSQERSTSTELAMQRVRTKSPPSLSNQIKKNFISSDLQNITLVKKNSNGSSSDQPGKKEQNPSYQSYESVLTYIYTIRDAFGAEDTPRFLEPRPSLLKIPEGNSLSLAKQKYKTDEEYRLKVSFSIVAFSCILLQMLTVSQMSDNKYQRYKLTKSLIEKGVRTLGSVPKIKDTFYEHSSYMNIILKYQIQDILKSNPNILYRIHHLPKSGQIKSKIKITAKSPIKHTIFFREFDKDHLLNLLQKLLIKNHFHYLETKIKAFTHAESIADDNQVTEAQEQPPQNDRQKVSSYLVNFDSLRKEYLNPFKSTEESYFNHPSTLINKINRKIHFFYSQKSEVTLKESLRQNYIPIFITALLLSLWFISLIVISDKAAKYVCLGIIMLSQTIVLILFTCTTTLGGVNTFRQYIQSLLEESVSLEFQYSLLKQSLHIRVTCFTL